MGLNPGAVPGMREAESVWSPPNFCNHDSHSGHHEPGFSCAFSSHASGFSGRCPEVQKQYFFPSGGLTTPAIWPEAASVNVAGPPSSRVHRNQRITANANGYRSQ